jgi:hypothetical protein
MAPAGFFCAASCRGPVLITGVTSEEPAVTRVVAAGSVVSCDSVRSGAGACCTAFCTTGCGDLRPSGGGGRRPRRRRVGPTNHILEVVLPRHQVVLGRDLRRMPEPLRDHVRGILFDPVGLARGPQNLQEPRPGLVSGLPDDPLQVGPEVDALPGRHRHHERCARLRSLERFRQDRPQVRGG